MRSRSLLLIVAGVVATVTASGGAAADAKIQHGTIEHERVRPVNKDPKANKRAGATQGRRTAIKLPFLGEIQGVSRQKTRSVRTEGGGRMPLKFQVFTTNQGRFVQAKFFKAGAVDYANSVEEVEAGMKAGDQEIIGLVDDPNVDPWERVLAFAAEAYPLDHVTQLSITLVRYRLFDNPPKPMFLVHVFGTRTIGSDGPYTEPYKRVRYVIGARLEKEDTYRCDNKL